MLNVEELARKFVEDHRQSLLSGDVAGIAGDLVSTLYMVQREVLSSVDQTLLDSTTLGEFKPKLENLMKRVPSEDDLELAVSRFVNRAQQGFESQTGARLSGELVEDLTTVSNVDIYNAGQADLAQRAAALLRSRADEVKSRAQALMYEGRFQESAEAMERANQWERKAGEVLELPTRI